MCYLFVFSNYNEFNSSRSSCQKKNCQKLSNQYHYIRVILNLFPDGSSQSIQKRLYVDFKSTFDNSSPAKLRIYALIYGIKNDALHDLDQSIYDWEIAHEVSSDEKFTLHMPINMNGFDILKTSHYLHGYLITNASDKTFIINGNEKVLLPNGSINEQIQILYNSFKFNYKLLNIEINYGFRLSLHDFFVSNHNTQKQTFNINITLQNGHFKVKLLNKDVPNEELNILIQFIHENNIYDDKIKNTYNVYT